MPNGDTSNLRNFGCYVYIPDPNFAANRAETTTLKSHKVMRHSDTNEWQLKHPSLATFSSKNEELKINGLWVADRCTCRK